MGKEWQNVRKRFHYPQLPQPELVDDIPNGSIDLKNLEIKVSEPFIQSFEQHGINTEEAMNEVLTHELTHFMRFPGSVLNILKLQKAAQGLTDGNSASELRYAFTEAQTNLYMTQELNHPTTARMRKAYGLAEGADFGKLIYGLYQEISGQDFGVKLSREEKKLVEKLRDIRYLFDNTTEEQRTERERREPLSFRKFVEVMKEYQPPQNKDKEDGQGKGKGRNSSDPCSGNGNGLEGFTENQIREGLRQFAQECSSPQEYEEVVKQVLNEDAQKEEIPQEKSQTSGRRAGTEKGIAELADNFYTALAEKYTIPIRKKQLHKNGSLYPHSHTPFEVGDSITEVDAFSTPGILPGITKKWVRKEGEVHSNEESIPDSFIVIDSSQSMPNPKEGVSMPVLGATAISNAYLVNGSEVSIYNFSGIGNKILYGPSKDRKGIHQTLRTYFNGGTVFDPSTLREVLGHYNNPFDMSVVSDMEISNLPDFVSAILSVPQTHRVHLLWTDPSKKHYVDNLRQSFGSRENVAILPLTKYSDIEKITMGELRKSVR